MDKFVSACCRIALIAMLCWSSSVMGANVIKVSDLGDIPINTTGTHEVSILLDADQPVLGFSVYMEYDDSKVEIQSIALGDDAAAVSPEWDDGEFDNAAGELKYGVVFDLSGPTITKMLAAGSDLEILKLTLEVSSTTTGSTSLNLRNITSAEPRLVTIMTDEMGDTVNPTLEDGSVTFIDLSPDITSVSPTSGDPGEAITIQGSGFDEPGLAVSICGASVTFDMVSDTRITTTAPNCGEGPAVVEVCTDYGCDTRTFTYLPQPGAPQITSFPLGDNSGFAGDVFHVDGTDFDQPNLSVEVCGSPAAFTLLGNGQTIEVTAPDCGSEGFAVVTVCTDLGCDSEPEGFFYEERPAPVIELILSGEGAAGDAFTITGRNFDHPGRTVTVCGVLATHSLVGLGGSTLDVVAPSCGTVGPAVVEVCTDWGCDSDPEGFTYEAGGGFIRGDSNADGNVDLSDGVYTLNYLFIGGPTPGCLDAADTDDAGSVDLTDAVYTFNYLFLGGNDIPPPSVCGEDPTTSDAYDCAVIPDACL